jgi:hypothetical protein
MKKAIVFFNVVTDLNSATDARGGVFFCGGVQKTQSSIAHLECK